MEGLRAREPLKAIAARLEVTISTVATQQRRAQRKLGASDRAAALRRWSRLRKGYVASQS